MTAIIWAAAVLTVLLLILAADTVAGLIERSGALRRLKEDNRALAVSRDRARAEAKRARAETEHIRNRLDAAEFFAQGAHELALERAEEENKKLRRELTALERKLALRERLQAANEE